MSLVQRIWAILSANQMQNLPEIFGMLYCMYFFLVNAYLSSTGKPNVCWSPKFSSIMGSCWLLKIFPLTHTGHCDLFGFGFTTLSSKAPKYILSTIYTLTSVYIFSILFSADHFLSSHDLNVYFRVDTYRRK